MASASDDGTVRVWGPAPFIDSPEADGLNGKCVKVWELLRNITMDLIFFPYLFIFCYVLR